MPTDQETETLFRLATGEAARFRRDRRNGPQRPLADYARSLDAFAAPAPEDGEDCLAVIETLIERAEPGLHTSAGRRFFAWVIGSSHPVAVAADMLTSAWGQNAGNHVAAPSAAACETVAAGWLLDLLDLPRTASVGFVTGATMANVVSLAAARGAVLRRAGWDVEAQGLFGAPPITVLIGDDAHSTVFSALQYLGLGHSRVKRVATDGQGAILPEAFAAAAADIPTDAPLIVLTQAGQINTGAFDPFGPIVEALARHSNRWVHVDGAFGLWARACPSRTSLAEGVERADSWATDGHKWLQTTYDCGYAIVRDAEAHRRAMTIAASYLPSADGGERDPSHTVPELSRRARGFPTWAMLHHLGRAGIAAMVERHCRLAQRFADRLSGEPGVAIRNVPVLNQVIVRFGADRPAAEGDALTQATIARIQTDGVCYAGGSLWRGEWVMRLSVIGHATDESDVDASSDAILAAWRCVAGKA